MEISQKTVLTPYGEITITKLTNNRGASVELSSLGAGIISLSVPDRNGTLANVLLGYADLADYMADGPCMGKTAGRYANRIAHGLFTLDDHTHRLAVNCGPHHLHGGPTGFQNRIWKQRLLPDGIEYLYTSAHGEENYPGALQVTCRYHWSEDNTLSIEYEAQTDAPTVVNLTNHSYWNLGGEGSGCALDHLLSLRASQWLETDPTLAPTGRLRHVEDTPMDFRTPKSLDSDIKAAFDALNHGKGYDHCWAIDDWKPGRFTHDVAILRHLPSGRILTIGTDQPGLQLYTGNWLTGSPKGTSGNMYNDYDGVALEMQGFPDAPNHPGFPSQRLDPGETYQRRITYSFSTE